MAAVATLTLEQLAADINKQAEVVRGFLNSQAGNTTKKKITVLSVAGAKEHFDKSRSPEGVPWPALRIRQGKPLLDTGRTRASIAATFSGSTVVLSANGVQAGIMNAGGVIRAKKKYLAIPLTAEARRAGSPRSIAGLHFQGKKGQNRGVLADKEGKPVFALVPSVKIPARPFLGWSQATLAKIDRVLIEDVTKALGAGNG